MADISSWYGRILAALKELIHELTGARAEDIEERVSFLEMGVDSLLMIQASQKIEERFQVKLSMIELLEELTTLESVARRIEDELGPARLSEVLPPAAAAAPVAENRPALAAPAAPEPAPAVPRARPAPPPPTAESPAGSSVAAPAGRGAAAPLAAAEGAPPASSSAVEALMAQQLQVMSLQLQFLADASLGGAGTVEAALKPRAPASPAVQAPPVAPVAPPDKRKAGAAPKGETAPYEAVGPYQPIQIGSQELNEHQKAYLDDFTRAYNERTARSKALAQESRPVLADGRFSVGFRKIWKELVYPIQGHRSAGSRVWDVDGNEYVDVSMGFGLHFFGHSPPFVMEALERQMRLGIECGPHAALTGEVAKLVCELTGHDRAIFCNSGTEAVMGALRIARTYTRRNKVALLSNSYHGWWDGTLARRLSAGRVTDLAPSAPGVSPGALEDVMMVPYNEPASIDLLRAHLGELAAVLVEPVRSRSPEVRPREFLHQLRDLTAGTETLLIFDEMVTGFRVHPRGAQGFFDVQADLATYGKLIAAGLPIGVIAGGSKFMDVLDGGMWQYGDDSYPRAEKTIFSGAFFKNPLTMAASWAVLDRLKQGGPALHERLNERTARLVENLNEVFRSAGAPIEAVCFGSLYRLKFGREVPSEIFAYHLIANGVFYTLETGTCFMTTAHSDDDLEHIENAVRSTVEQMQRGGFLPPPPGGAPGGGGKKRAETAVSADVELPVAAAAGAAAGAVAQKRSWIPELLEMSFSLYYFGNYEAAYDPAKYELLLAGARYADRHDFTAVWLPERHFDAFGGLSPNPAVVASALARETSRLQLRGGSVVLPLHQPIRVAEEWSVVDNLSGGRVGIAFASGWHPNDFVFAPDHYGTRRQVMFRGIEDVLTLWRGGKVRARDGAGNEVEVGLFPLPKQPDLPIWLTSSSSETFRRAGAMGAGVLTNLQIQSVEELAAKLELYYEALELHGHDPSRGRVALLLHTFLSGDRESARSRAEGPLREYLRSSFRLVRKLVEGHRRLDIDFERLPPAELDFLMDQAYRRYADAHALVGTVDSCAPIVERLLGLGVTEIGSLVDFGLDQETVLGGLEHLAQLRSRFAAAPGGRAGDSRRESAARVRAGPAAEEAASPPAPRPAPAAAIAAESGEAPLTPSQRALWVECQTGADACRAYNEPTVLRLRGPFDVDALGRALREVVERHAVLRAGFSANGESWRIEPTVDVEVERLDLSSADEPEREARARAWLRRQVGDPFDLEKAPLWRSGVARLGEDDHYFALTVHHLAIDGHAAALMMQELRHLYAAALRGVPAALEPALPFAPAMRRIVDRLGPEMEATEAFWRERFEGSVPYLELPTDRPRRRVVSYSGSRRRRSLDLGLVSELRGLGAERGATAYMILLSAFGVFLHRLTGNDDLVVGVPSRDPSAPRQTVGFFLSLMPLRLRSSGFGSFNDYLKAAKTALLEAQAHRAYPLSRLVEKLNPDRSRSQVVAATFNLERGGDPPGFLDVRAEVVRMHPGASRFDLLFNLIEEKDVLHVECDYRSELFDASTVDRFLSHFETLLRGVAADPSASPGALPLLSAAQRHQLLEEWNDTARRRAGEGLLHELFAVQAGESPAALAVASAGAEVTYRELDERSNRLARYLRGVNVTPETVVGICLAPHPELLVALLGVLKAGGAYLPLDPAHPRDRRSFVLRDGGARLVLTSTELAGLFSREDGIRVIALDGVTEEIAAQSAASHPSGAGPDHLAYVLYTSGSTGRPKGVMVPHRGLANYLRWCREAYGGEAGAPVHSSIGFDLTVTGLFTPLLAGGSVLFPADEGADALASVLRDPGGFSLVKLTPAHLEALRQSFDGEAAARSTSLFVVGGEALPRDVARYWREHAPATRIVNEYGPTEAVVGCSVYEVAGTEEAAVVPIGRPIPNVRLHVLDRHGAASPVGAAGELHVAGDGLARGYLGRRATTAESFVPDPWCAGPGGRLYRTGDRARYLADGNLEFLGRIDHQIKLRGYRIEPGEVEAVLAEHPQVGQAAVIVRGDTLDDRRLVAYYVPVNGPEGESIEDYLARRLPEYMVPSAIVRLAEMPLTPNGKADRRALAELPQDGAADEEAPYVAPRTLTEEMLAEIWSQVLAVDRVGVDDDFFELGGHSLLAMQVSSRVLKAFGVRVPVLRRLVEAPTLRGLAAVVDEKRREGQIAAAPAIARVSRDRVLPLSFAQQRLWFLNRLEPESVAYQLPSALRVKGRLEMEALGRALTEVVRRHESLRTAFAEGLEGPFQVVGEPAATALPIVDLALLPESRIESEVRGLVRDEPRRRFDLGRGPLFRVRLLRVGSDEHVLLINMHHIVSDGWSLGVLVRELVALYRAFSEGRPSPLPELEIQYPDYAVWQRSWLRGEVLEEQLEFWRGELSKAAAALALPTDRPRPALQSYRGGSESLAMSAELTSAFRGLCRGRSATPTMSFLAAFQALLRRYSGQRFISVGIPVANRQRLETEGLIGFFANTVVLASDLSGAPSFEDLLDRTRDLVIRADLHQDLPFELLVEELEPERDLSRNPLFQVMLVLQNESQNEAVEIPGLVVEPLRVPAHAAMFDLLLMVTEGAERFHLSMNFNADVFDRSTGRRILDHLCHLISAAVAEPGRSIAALPVSSPAERHQTRVEWNDTVSEGFAARTFPELFAEQAERSPRAVAARFSNRRRLTYRQLDRRSNRLARLLRENGVGADDVVALFAERHLDFLTAVLGIFKAGGAYLPLDHRHPPRRLAQVLAGSGARLVLVDSASAAAAEEALAALGGGRRPACLSLETLLGQKASDALVMARLDPSHLAYVIYTSGSTGAPKGAMVHHRGMANHLAAKIRDLRLGPGDQVAQTSSQCFDISVWQMLAALVVGGTVHMVPDATTLDPSELLDEVRRSKTTVLEVVPSMLREILDRVEQEADPAPWLAELRWIIPTGEALPPDLARRWARRFPRIPMVNAYGPTECSDDVTHHFLPGPPAGLAPVPIGRPVVNTRIYLLDRRLSAVPLGVAGELGVAGTGVGRGYLREVSRSAEVFVPDPLTPPGQPGSRLYRTGDLGRFTARGSFVFLGRRDHQVKVRGFRIELEEIEAALHEHPAVDRTVVLGREQSNGDHRLVAYVVSSEPRPETAGLISRLRRDLEEKLPDYMVPGTFVFLEALPLTPNGKVDRKALPAPPAAGGEGRRLAPAGTPTEEILSGIWSEVLGAGAIGRDSNFFELGGHSLLATRVCSRIRAVFEVEMPVLKLFERPTVTGLAREIDALRSRRGAARIPAIEKADRSGPLPLSFAQQRLWFLEQLDPQGALYNLPSAFRLEGPLDTVALTRSLDEIFRRHESLRTSFPATEGEPRQAVGPAGPMPFQLVDLRRLPPSAREREARRRVAEQSQRPFDLARGPLARVCLLRLAGERHVALLAMHHIISDGWSMVVLVREMSALYEAFARRRPSTLPELPIQYPDFSAWQRRWLVGELLEAEIGYWRRRLAGAPALLELPSDRPRPAVKTFRGAVVGRDLPPAVAGELESLGRARGVTLFMTILAAWKTLLARYSGLEDVVVGTPIAGRNRLETEGLIGFFVNTLVLRTDLSGRPSFAETLQRIRQGTLGAFDHQDLPFERIVEELRPERNLSHTPIFQVMFVFQQAFAREPPRLPGLEVRQLEPGGLRRARFDLTLLVDRSDTDLSLAIEHNTDLFDGVTAERMLGQLARWLGRLSEESHRPVDELPLLGPAERHALTVEWPVRPPVEPAPPPVPEMVARWAKETPAAPALVTGEVTVSYGELDDRAGRLAARLSRLGLEPGAHVGIACQPSPEMVVALLAVWKLGATHVPLDAALPRERLRWQIDDAGLAAILTENALRSALPETGETVVCLDAEAGEPAPLEPFTQVPLAPASAAYVIYTSGSTGTPKGVVAHHDGLARFVRAMSSVLELGPGDRMLQFASLAFDASAVQIWPTLASGSALVLHRDVRRLSSHRLLELCADSGVTVLDLPAALWRQWVGDVAESGEKIGAPIRFFLTGGETVPGSVLRSWAARVDSGVRFLSSYGPTETTVTATAFVTSAAEALRNRDVDVPIGRPLGESRAYVLDARLSPVPAGAWADLWVGGPGVTRGYLGDPRATAARFVADPRGEAPGTRLYRTGDLARHLGDGQLQFLGRRDHQVKVRGYRVELGEIAAAIGRYPSVKEKTVVVREALPGDRRLVAYVTVEENDAFSEGEILDALREVLPEHMVPSRVVVLAELPLLPSGKVDLRSLPEPEARRGAPDGDLVGPRTTLELELVQLWEELLERSPVGVRDSFFELGAHSLLAVRLIARLRSRYSRDVTVGELFEEPTVERLAKLLAAKGVARTWSPLVALQPGGSRPPLFCVHPIGGEVLSYFKLAHYLGPDQPFYGLQAPNLADQSQEEHASIEEMAASYVDALESVQQRGPYYLGGISFGGVVAFEMARQLRGKGESIAFLAIVDAPAPRGGGPKEIDDAVLISSLVREHARRAGKDLPMTAEDLANLDLDTRLSKVLAELRRLRLIGEEIDLATLRKFILGNKKRVAAVESYVPKLLRAPITVVRAGELDPEHLKGYTDEERRLVADPAYGWSPYTDQEVTVVESPGFHETMTAEPHVETLARILREHMDLARAGAPA